MKSNFEFHTPVRIDVRNITAKQIAAVGVTEDEKKKKKVLVCLVISTEDNYAGREPVLGEARIYSLSRVILESSLRVGKRWFGNMPSCG